MTSNQNFDCRLLPHGAYTLLPATLSSMAWIASLAQDGCDFSRLTGPSVAELTGSDAIPFVEVGFNAYRQPEFFSDTNEWRVQYTGKCIDYSGEVPDSYWILSKAFSFIALVFGGGGALFLWCSSCFVFGPGTWRWAGYEILTASIFQCLSFMWFLTRMCKSEGNTCALFFGSRSDIVATSLWFISAMTIFFRYPKPARKLNPRRMNGLHRDDENEGGDPMWDVHSEHNNNRAIHLDDATIPNQRELD